MNTLTVEQTTKIQEISMADEDAVLDLFAEELPDVSDLGCANGCCCCWSTASTSLSCLVSTASTCCA